MENLLVKDSSLVKVSNAIQQKSGTRGQLQFPDGFVNAINQIQTGTVGPGQKEEQALHKVIEKNNSSQTYYPDPGKAIGSCEVKVQIPEESPVKTYSSNSTYIITPSNTDALLKQVTVNVNVPTSTGPGPGPVIDETISSKGLYSHEAETCENEGGWLFQTYKVPNNVLLQAGATIELDSQATILGNATASQVKKGVTFSSKNGLGITGSLVESTTPGPDTGGIDTSDATAVAGDIQIDKTAYVNGKKITGTIPVIDSSNAIIADDVGSYTSEVDGTEYVTFTKYLDTAKAICEGDIYLDARMDGFGTATAADVALGKTFTSAAGLLVKGTATGSSGGGGNTDLNAEVAILKVPNLKPNFKTNTGKLKVWGWAANGVDWQATIYIFCGDYWVPTYLSGAQQEPLTLGLDASGNITGLPARLVQGDILAVMEK